MLAKFQCKQICLFNYNIMKLIERARQRTPKFFRNLQKAAVVITGISAAILSSPVALPLLVVNFAGYLATAGTVAAVLSQVAVTSDDPE